MPFCFLGFHKWEYSNTFLPLLEAAGIPPAPGAYNRRECERCGKVQVYNSYITPRWRKPDGLGGNGDC